MKGDHVVIPAAQIEFVDGGNTLWVHAPDGSTALRIKVTGKIRRDACATSPSAHGDAMIEGDLHICVPKGKRTKP